jgi:hypothetical protein
VDEHLWHHTTKEGEGAQGVDRHSGFDQARWRQQARLLDRLPGRSGKAYAEWLSSRGATFAAGEDGDAGRLSRGPARTQGDGTDPPRVHRNNSVTAAANLTRCIGSAKRCGQPISSPPARSSESRSVSKPVTRTSKSPSPGAATSSCGRVHRHQPRRGPSARRSLRLDGGTEDLEILASYSPLHRAGGCLR